MQKIILFLVLTFGLIANAPADAIFGGENDSQKGICLMEEQRAVIRTMLHENEIRLLQQRKMRHTMTLAHPLFIRPIKQVPGYRHPGFWAIPNFLDHSQAPGDLLDYNGGERTYDLPSGYNHKGTDFIGWPFAWAKLYLNEVKVIAASPGTILGKDDGNFDRQCSRNNIGIKPNAVFIRHDDGSQAWYLHLKNGSLTKKAVGSRVAGGELLGIMGSSGYSLIPHLHFEIYASDGALQDTFKGPSNRLNSDTWWKKQPAYRDSAINKLLTHKAPPKFNNCSSVETTNVSNEFKPGEKILFAAYYRDQEQGQTTNFTVTQPGGAVFESWQHVSPDTFDRSFWLFAYQLPANAPLGNWIFSAKFGTKTVKQIFIVVSSLKAFQITSITPASLKAGQETVAEITGSGFKKGMGASVQNKAKDEIKANVLAVQVLSDQKAKITFAIDTTAAAGLRTLILTRPDYVQTVKTNLIQIIK